MKILLTGASSFTGMHIVEALLEKGHDVYCTTTTMTRNSLSASRLNRLKNAVSIIDDCPFGSARFLDVISKISFDIFWHHGAWTQEYRSWDFDLHAAIQSNTFNIHQILKQLSANGCQHCVLTGSIFEGQDLNKPFTPYGLSKHLTRQIFELYCTQHTIQLGYVVIPNPFGEWDNPKLLDHLLRHWLQDEIPSIFAPETIRDNIPVDLLAMAAADWLAQWVKGQSDSIFRPSGYVSTMAEFVERTAQRFQDLYNLPAPFTLNHRAHHQPSTLINSQNLFRQYPQWNEEDFWQRTFSYHHAQISPRKTQH